MKHYLQTDGNGGVTISKSMVAFLLLVIAIISGITQVVVQSTTVKAAVKHIEENVLDNEVEIDNLSKENNQIRTDFERSLVKIDGMADDVKEIKQDIKEIKDNSI